VRGTVVLRTEAGAISVGAAAGVSASLDAGTTYGRIHNALKKHRRCRRPEHPRDHRLRRHHRPQPLNSRPPAASPDHEQAGQGRQTCGSDGPETDETVGCAAAPPTVRSPSTDMIHFLTLEKGKPMTIKHSAWTGMVPVDDTALAVTDTGGPGCPVVYLNGTYVDQSPWRRVIAELGSGYRHITYDERARGKSKRAADYSFEACVRDVDAVLEARGVERPIVVGWSYGAALAAHWADRNPDRVVGMVAVDGAVPYGLTGEEARERIRKLFHRMRLLLPLVRPLGLAARMTIDQHAEINIELNEISAAIAPVLDRLTCPVRYVLATGASLGGAQEEMEQMRASLDPVLARNPNLTVSAKVASNHSKILRKDFRAVADAVRELAPSRSHADG
jgi:pimeloyl-ACP methyl ester carboxylesterase